jgi:CHAT domain-containing protein
MMRFKRTLFSAIVAALLLPAQVHAQLGFLQMLVPMTSGNLRAQRIFSIQQQADTGDLQGAIVLAEELITEDSANAQAFNPLNVLAQGFSPLNILSPGFNMSTASRQSTQLAADLHVRAREYDRAIELYQLELDWLPRKLATVPRVTMGVRMKIADAYEKSGNLQAARDIYRDMLAQMDEHTDAYVLERKKLHSESGRLALAANDIPAARDHLVLAIDNLIQIQDQAANSSGRNEPGFTSFTTAMNDLSNAMALARESTGSLNRNRDLTDSEGGLVNNNGEARMKKNAMMDIQSPFMDLAEIYRSQSDGASLRQLYENEFSGYASKVLAAPLKGFMAGNVEFELLYARFGTYLAGAGQDAQARDAFGKALELNAKRLESVSRRLAPKMLSDTFASRREILGVYLSFALSQRPQSTDVMRKLAGDAMQSKGLEGEMLAELSRAIALSPDTEVRRLRRKIDEAASDSSERFNLEATLQGKVASLIQPLQFEDGKLFLDRVSARIGDATLVSVLQFRLFDFRKQQFDAARYLGVSLTRSKMSTVDIGLVGEINALAARARSEMARPASAVAAKPALAKALYARLLQPLIGPNMQPGRYVADMDGAINLLPLETLVDGTGRYLIEQGSWTYVSSARALLRKQDRPMSSNASIVIVNPDFNAGVATTSDPITRAFFQNSVTLRAADGAALSSATFTPLPETMDEGQAVAAALRRMSSQIDIQSGAASTAGILRSAHAPRFLHIATHGFFLVDAGTSRQNLTGKDGRKFTLEERDPGLNSGLAFAGANNTISSGQGDGVLFSSQIRQLNLQGTELVVLSACDTGVGTVNVGEGVESLRQALELAGARSTVTSLWKVPSLATRDLMVAFYDAMASGASKPEAMRQAKIKIMRKSPQPFYWGAFVLSGID